MSLLIFFMRCLSKLPFSTVQGIGRLLGRAILRFDQRTVKAIDHNLAICFPDQSHQQRRAIRNARLAYMGQILFEMSHLWTKDTSTLLSYLQPGFDNSEFEEAIKGDRGIIFLAPHIGNWEVMNSYLGQFCNPTFMYRPQRSDTLDRFIYDSRKRVGANLAPANNKGVAQLIKALNTSNTVGILPDQVPQEGGGVYAPFYGQEAYTMTLAHKLSQKTQAQVFIAAAYQMKGGYQVLVEPVDSDFYSDDAHISATALNRSIESVINRYPEQYQWEYKRFKKQANGERFYPKG
ncbi:lipid A biosynthesis acyltransferase [Marinomonas agarivorans]|nr:lipid A biosynthesis acyltransferase [Marinomonas agarivorans]